MARRSLLTGVAYHGNRMPSHAREDIKEIARADMDIVVHMLSHTDWERHKNVMKDIFAMTEDAGMEVWVDNWGLGGPPGDKSHFLAYHPEAHMIFSDGEMHPSQVCLNSPVFRKFIKDWLYTVAEIGGKTIFWDEPYIPEKKIAVGESTELRHCCACPTCKKLFEERYGRPMPIIPDADVEKFRTDSIVEYFADVTEYSNSLGQKNATCVMLGGQLGISLDNIDALGALPYMQNIGSDPYWYGKMSSDPYKFVYDSVKKNVGVCQRFEKDHNIWIQTYAVPRGREEEIIQATEAAYDAGARTILAWGYKGSESNDYRAADPERTWNTTVEAMRRIRSMERDRILAENRKKVGLI